MKILVVFGTRPEAIKFIPIIKALEAAGDEIETRICITGQHRDMLDQIMKEADLTAHYDLDIMQDNQTLTDINVRVMTKLKPVLEDFQPDRLMVQGDTTTTFAAAQAAFYANVAVDHIEAGLRSFDKQSPWPEEVNRRLVSVIADHHFAPTTVGEDNLIREGADPTSIYVTGNTVVDTLLYFTNKINTDKNLSRKLENRFSFLDEVKHTILVTCHRRENHGEGIRNICEVLKKLSRRPDTQVVFPVHPNPNIKNVVYRELMEEPDIFLVEPLCYVSLVYLMNQIHLVLTDSGGIQEEAPSLGKPVLVLRDTTERPEGIEAGTVKLVGTNTDHVLKETTKLLDNRDLYQQMSFAHNPYGDGRAAERIVNVLLGEREEEKILFSQNLLEPAL